MDKEEVQGFADVFGAAYKASFTQWDADGDGKMNPVELADFLIGETDSDSDPETDSDPEDMEVHTSASTRSNPKKPAGRAAKVATARTPSKIAAPKSVRRAARPPSKPAARKRQDQALKRSRPVERAKNG
eukprot:COSAG02_NODE_6787_length_3361_cov_5.477928_3_plen_130_part_00